MKHIVALLQMLANENLKIKLGFVMGGGRDLGCDDDLKDFKKKMW
jgi:hypothetical protein